MGQQKVKTTDRDLLSTGEKQSAGIAGHPMATNRLADSKVFDFDPHANLVCVSALVLMLMHLLMLFFASPMHHQCIKSASSAY